MGAACNTAVIFWVLTNIQYCGKIIKIYVTVVFLASFAVRVVVAAYAVGLSLRALLTPFFSYIRAHTYFKL